MSLSPLATRPTMRLTASCPRIGVQVWDELDADEKRLAAPLMEVYTGFIHHADAQIARAPQADRRPGQARRHHARRVASPYIVPQASPSASVPNSASGQSTH